MEHISVKKKVDRLIVKHKIEKTEQISTMELDIINKREIVALLPVQLHKRFMGKELMFVIQDYQDLRSFLKSGISFDIFVKVIVQVIKTLQSCESHGIRCGNLELNSDLSFFDYKSQQVRMIYWPLISVTSTPNISAFFLELGSIYVSKKEDSDYRIRYLQLFDSRAKFELDGFEKQVEMLFKKWKEKDEPIVDVKVKERKDDLTMTVGLRTSYLQRVSTNQTIEITRYPFTIGRVLEYCDYALEENNYVSRRHVTILLRNGQAYIRDNGSANGTFLDGMRIKPNTDVELCAGSKFVIGREEFVYRPAGVC